MMSMHLTFMLIFGSTTGELFVAEFARVTVNLKMFGVDVVMQIFGGSKLGATNGAHFFSRHWVSGDHCFSLL